MESHHYTCHYCQKEFVPKRRKVQKFCSTSCRVRHHQASKGLKANQSQTLAQPVQDSKPMEVERISAAGIGNAAIGTTAADFIKSLLTKEENKTATKADLKRIEEMLQRYHKVENMDRLGDGRVPYFDMQLRKLVYK